MSLVIHNTLSREKEPFVPLDPAHVRLYVLEKRKGKRRERKRTGRTEENEKMKEKRKFKRRVFYNLTSFFSSKK